MKLCDAVNLIREKTNLLDVVKNYSTPMKCGTLYRCSCPFHTESTPSFVIHPTEQKFHCFGCGESGDVINFLAKAEKISYRDAVLRLSDVPIDHERPIKKEIPEKTSDTILKEIYKHAMQFYRTSMANRTGTAGYLYFHNRNLSRETMEKFQLGFAPYDSKKLFTYLRLHGFTPKMIEDANIFRTYGDFQNDPLKNRAIFPIFDVDGNPIAFGGRRLNDDSNAPKYINSTESDIFKKSKNMYAMQFAKDDKSPFFLLCEGYMDVIALHQGGFGCAVASLGTSLTQDQAKLMRKYKSDVVICYDTDVPGQKATDRAIGVLRKAGLNIRVTNTLPYKDPDEFIKAEGKEAFEKRLAEAVPAAVYEAEQLKKEYDMVSPEGIAEYYQAMMERNLISPEEISEYYQALFSDIVDDSLTEKPYYSKVHIEKQSEVDR